MTLPCPDGCTCRRHITHTGGRRPCPPNCKCATHRRTDEHNARIGMSVRLTAEAKRKMR